MKKCMWLNYLLVCVFLGLFTACSDDDNEDNNENYTQDGIIQISTNGSRVDDFYVYTYHEGEILSIDWGDGRSSRYYTLYSEDEDWGSIFEPEETKHDYSHSHQHLITIKGNIKMLIYEDYGISYVDASKCPQVQVLWFERRIDSLLNVNGCSALRELNCESGDLTTLDLSGCTALSYLNCAYNDLVSLNISDCKALVELDCSYNELTSLSLPKSNTLHCIDISGNELNDTALNAIYNSLPTVSNGQIRIYSNPGEGNYSIAEGKGWNVER